MKELLRKASTKEKPSKEFIEIIKDKNITMQDDMKKTSIQEEFFIIH